MLCADVGFEFSPWMLVLISIGSVMGLLECSNWLAPLMRRLIRPIYTPPVIRSDFGMESAPAVPPLTSQPGLLSAAASQRIAVNTGPARLGAGGRLATKVAAPANQDHRTSPRRKGEAVPIEITDAKARGEPYQGSVTDRSRTGLCLIVDKPILVGTMLRVRSLLYEDEAPWVEVEVRNCRAKGQEYKLGCQLIQALPWSTVLLFG